MQVGLHTRLQPGAEEHYEEYHRAVWPDVLKAIRRVGISKYVIFRDGLDLFHYIECDDYDRVVEAAWQAGIRLFDTAPLYGHGLAEQRMGAVLRAKPRDEFVLATKVGRLLRGDAPPEPGQAYKGVPPVNPIFDFSYDGVMRSVEESLGRLGLDRVDVLHIHDPDEHFEQALAGAYRALDRLRAEGTIKAVGAGMNQAEMRVRLAQ